MSLIKHDFPASLVGASEVSGFTARISAAVIAYGSSNQSAAVTIPADKSVLAYFDGTAATEFIVEASNNGGSSWYTVESFINPAAGRVVKAYFADSGGQQLRFTAMTGTSASTTVTVATQARG